ncbi:hypothetical protein GPALN_005435 [Globodera pallida]|nr:hypothetical protein GPALN_005435 [Globodera pallida]
MRPSSSVHSSLRSAASVSAHSAALRNFAHIPKSVSGHFDSDQQHHTAATTTKTVPFVPLQLHIVKDRKHERRRVIEQREGAKRQCPGRDNRQIAADKLGRAESIELDGLKRFSRKLEASARLEEADIARLKQQG